MHFDCPPWPPAWPEISSAVQECLQSGQWGRYHSQTCRQLQSQIAALFAAPHCRLCCSGTAALELALRAINLKPGGEVLLSAYDYPGNFRTIELLGGRPVLVDTAADSPCLDVDSIAAVASEKVVAVVASHLFGRALDAVELRQVCDQHGWIFIEDACQAPGMLVEGVPAGAHGHVATLSFGGSKPVSAGAGGALLVHSDRIAAKLAGIVDRPGDTFAISPLGAAAIAPQLDRLASTNAARLATTEFLERQIVARLEENGWNWISSIESDVRPAYYKIAWTAETSQMRARIINAAEEIGLPIGAGFRTMSGCSERRCRKPVATPRADQLSETLFVLDHSALLLAPEQYASLGEALLECSAKAHSS